MKCQLNNKQAVDNTRTFLQEIGVIDNDLQILNLQDFLEASQQLSDDASKAYGVHTPLWEVDPINNRFAIPNLNSLSEIDKVRKQLGLFEDQIAGSILSETSVIPPDNQVQYKFRVINALQTNNVREPKSDNLQGFYNDLQKQGIPNQQIDLVKDILADINGKVTKEDVIRELLVRYSYSVEVKTAGKYEDYRMVDKTGEGDFEPEPIIDGSGKFIPSSYYSNLTVPGGTNYTENEIRTPGITPSITGHAQFSSNEGIGWFRSDDRVQYNTFEEVVEIMRTSGILKIKC